MSLINSKFVEWLHQQLISCQSASHIAWLLLITLDKDNVIKWIGNPSSVHATSLQMRADYWILLLYWSDVWRTARTSKLKICGWFFACSLLLGIANNYSNVIFHYLQKQKFYTCGQNVSYFASMIEVNFTKLPMFWKWSFWADILHAVYFW